MLFAVARHARSKVAMISDSQDMPPFSYASTTNIATKH